MKTKKIVIYLQHLAENNNKGCLLCQTIMQISYIKAIML